MKKNLIAYAAFAVILGVLAVSCVNEDYDNPAKAGTTIKVEQQPSELPSNDLIGIPTQSETVKANKNGDLVFSKDAKQPLKQTIVPEGEQVLNGDLKIELADTTPEQELLDKAEPSQPAVVLKVAGPAVSEFTIKADIKVDDSELVALPDVTVPSDKEEITIVYIDEREIKDAIVDADLVVALPSSCVEDFVNQPKEITIKNVKFEFPTTKAIAQSGETYEYKVEASYCVPFAFKKGSTFTVTKEFKDLGFDLTPYVKYKASEYKVTFKITNSMPFDLMMSATSSQGLEGHLNNPVKAGSIANPVTTEVVLTVVTKKDAISKLNDAVLTVELTAAEDNAKLNVEQGLQVDVETIHIDVI